MDQLTDACAKAIVRKAKKRGLKVKIIDARLNLYELSNGKKNVRVWTTLSDLTGSASAKMSRDKKTTLDFLARQKIFVPAHCIINKVSEAAKFLKRYKQVVVKPLNGQKGNGVSVGIAKKDFARAFKYAVKFDENVAVEEFVKGEDYRVLVIGYKFAAAMKRIPPQVLGDGKSSIKKLIAIKDQTAVFRVPIDQATISTLKNQHLTLKSVPKKGQPVLLRANANLATGGSKQDATVEFPRYLRKVAERIARLSNLPVVGIDLIVPKKKRKYWLIETNTRPTLVFHNPQKTVKKYLNWMFPETKK